MKTKKHETLYFNAFLQKHNGWPGEKTTTIILQKHLGNRNWSRAKTKNKKLQRENKEQKAKKWKNRLFFQRKIFRIHKWRLKKMKPFILMHFSKNTTAGPETQEDPTRPSSCKNT